MDKVEFKNWKLKEVARYIEVVSHDSDNYFEYLINKLNIPLTDHESTNRENTYIDWLKTSNYFKFYFDGDGEEKENEIAFKNSKLNTKDRIIINYGYNEPAVLVPTDIFIEDWEDFIASTQYETIIISEDLELIMEVSRDYYLHSNFRIK